MAFVEAGILGGGARMIDDRNELNVVTQGRRRQFHITSEQMGRDRMVHLASLLPEKERVLMLAYLQSDLTVRELALLHGTSPGQMRRRLTRLCEMLTNRYFQAVAERGKTLPGPLGLIARGYWLEGLSLRELARKHGETLHRVRGFLTVAKVLLAKRGDE